MGGPGSGRRPLPPLRERMLEAAREEARRDEVFERLAAIAATLERIRDAIEGAVSSLRGRRR